MANIKVRVYYRGRLAKIKEGNPMKTLVIGLFLVIGGLVSSMQTSAQIPPDLKREMRLEKPEHRGPAIELGESSLVAAILFYPKARLWVVTKIHIVDHGPPLRGRFTDDDVETISREIDGKQVELYRKKRERKEKRERGEENRELT
ncbi:MAG: hypothetical protein Q7R89_00520 [bacterium]|nr:hypothetical protein [bacterium]